MAVIIHFPAGRTGDKGAPARQPAPVVALSLAREQRARKRNRVMELLRAERLRAARAAIVSVSTAPRLTKESD
jgi:hypothetical protein